MRKTKETKERRSRRRADIRKEKYDAREMGLMSSREKLPAPSLQPSIFKHSRGGSGSDPK
jgi:hypothetical protein